ncbi:MAG: repeat protein [Bradyrhizobium sp.]|nr:repeat protein [Bradyrhizobium sp.]
MPFSADWTNAGIRFGGYADGTDWVVVPSGGFVDRAGFLGDRASATHAWAVVGPRNGTGEQRDVVLFDVAARRKLGSIPFDRVTGDTLLASRDGKRLHVVTYRHEGSRGADDYRYLAAEIVVIDAVTCAVASRHLIDDAYASLYREVAVETAEGHIRLPVSIAAAEQGKYQQAIATLDPRLGAVSLASLAEGGRYVWLSPRGRFALRPNFASLPIRDEPLLSLAGIGLGPKTRYYGLCLQLWEVEPVRYLRTIPVAWLTYDELPDDARSEHKRSAYKAIQAACESLAPDAHGPPPLTADKYPSDPTRTAVSAIHWDFAEQVVSEIVWADDEQSFWVRTYGFWSWVGVDGASSPRIRLERTGMAYGMVVPYANGPHLVEPLPGRKARFLFRSWRGAAHGRNGSAVVEAASPASFRAVQVYPKGNDGWQDVDFDSSAIVMRITAAISAMRTVKISLASLSAPDCIKAIASFGKKLRSFLKEAMTQESIDFSFEMAGRSLGEGAFFQHVESNAPGAVPELRKLVDRLVSAPGLVADGDDLPFCSGEWQLLGPAVKALGVLDRSALETVGKYGRMIDREHEYYFVGTTLPAIARAHGWTAEMVDFALSMLLTGFNIGSSLWRDGGMGAALAASTSPEDFAAHVLKAIAQEGPLEESFRFGHRQIYQLWEEIAPLTPWEARLFAALDAAVPSYDYPES